MPSLFLEGWKKLSGPLRWSCVRESDRATTPLRAGADLCVPDWRAWSSLLVVALTLFLPGAAQAQRFLDWTDVAWPGGTLGPYVYTGGDLSTSVPARVAAPRSLASV